MKKPLLIIATILVISALVRSQDQHWQLPENPLTVVTFENAKQESNDWIADKKIRLDSIAYEHYHEESWNLSFRRHFIYNNSGDLTAETRGGYDYETGAWFIYGKEQYEYDENGNLTQILIYEWDDVNNLLVFQQKVNYTYEAGNWKERLNYWWDDENNSWKNFYKEIYSYSLGEMTEKISYYWEDSGSSWIPSEKFEQIETNNGETITKYYYNWSEENNDWVGEKNYEYHYNQQGYLLKRFYSGWDNELNQWKNYDKKEIFYNPSWLQTKSILYRWDTLTMQWAYHFKWEYEYDTNSTPLTYLNYHWNEFNEQWDNWIKYEFAFNNPEEQAMQAYWDWDTITNQWIGDNKHEFLYDGNGNNTFWIHSQWDTDLNEWSEVLEEEFDFNMDFTVDELIYSQSSYFFNPWAPPNNIVNSSISKTHNDTGWVNSTRETLYYTEVTGIEDISEQDVRIYPNPANESITIEMQTDLHTPFEVRITDSRGRVVLNKTFAGKETIFTGDLKPGLYLVRMLIDGKISYRKVVVQ